MKKRLLFFVTEDWYFVSHRLDLAITAKNIGYEVLVVTNVREHGDVIRKAGLCLIPIEVRRNHSNPWIELKLFLKLIHIYRNERPDIVHHVALKPVIYGAVAAYFSGVNNVVSAIAGLGYVFTSSKWRMRLLRFFMRIAFRLFMNGSGNRVIFQNPDDRNTFVNSGLISEYKAILIKGSGVDMNIFQPTPELEGIPIVVFAGRMLWSKGVKVFVDAATIIKKEIGGSARFVLVGEPDLGSSNAVPISTLQEWTQEKNIEWWGKANDMKKVFSQSHIVCLPSAYGEGIPKVLIEAAAAGRPIITTDSPGCREIVINEKNGLLIPVNDTSALVKAIKYLIEDKNLRISMGKHGREIAETEFSIEKVITETLSVYEELLSR